MNQFTRLGIVVLAFGILTQTVQSQIIYGQLLYSDDFSSSNGLWRFKFIDTQGNQAAIDASYGKIEDGVLTLKANVGCGWDYLGSVASLQLPLPEDYILEYRATKIQWCGAFQTEISITNEIDDRAMIPPSFDFAFQGSWFTHLNVRSETNVVDFSPAITTQNNGTWYNVRIVKRGGRLKVFINDNVQFSYSGPLVSSGFLHFFTHQAGSTAQIDDLRIFEAPTALEIEVAAVRVQWFAEENVPYVLQATTDFQSWNTVANGVGGGYRTNVLDWTTNRNTFYRLVEGQ